MFTQNYIYDYNQIKFYTILSVKFSSQLGSRVVQCYGHTSYCAEVYTHKNSTVYWYNKTLRKCRHSDKTSKKFEVEIILRKVNDFEILTQPYKKKD